MLSPEEISAAARAAGACYEELELAVLEVIAGSLAAAVGRGDTYAGLVRGANEAQAEALRILSASLRRVLDAAESDARASLLRSLEDDLARMGVDASRLPGLVQASLHQSGQEAVRGITRIVLRDNLSMAADARSSWLSIASRYVTGHQAGGMGSEEAVKRAVRDLADRGVAVVDYASGARTRADAAVRRHLRSQISQTAAARTVQVMDGADWDLVEVSSHIGARPSHAEWQGRVYSRRGRHPRYPDFLAGTGYDGVRGPHAALGDRLCGVNCRHSFGPYLEGQPRAYSPTPDEDAGLKPGEAYEATQHQRAIERRIRAAKRRVAADEGAGLDSSLERVRLGVAQREMREWVKGHPYLRRQRAREQASELAAQPRPMTPSARARAMRDERVERGPNTVHRPAQNKHIPGTKEYGDKMRSLRLKAEKRGEDAYPRPSYFTMGADEVVRMVEGAVGTGRPLHSTEGDWYGREICRSESIVGFTVDRNGIETPTEWFKIHYSKRGVHGVPTNPPREDG